MGALLAFCLMLGASVSYASDVRILNVLFDSVLSSHVKDGYVDYPKLKKSSRFKKYVTLLESFDVSSLESRDHELAFWINTYNSLALKMVINGTTPVNAVGRMKFYRITEHKVAGKKYDLNAVKTMVEDYDDARIYFALVDASYAAPTLKSEVYKGSTLNEQLDSAVFSFVNDNRKNRFLPNLRVAKLSKIFERNERKFGIGDDELLQWVSKYHADEDVADDLMQGRVEVKYLDYEYSINGLPL